MTILLLVVLVAAVAVAAFLAGAHNARRALALKDAAKAAASALKK